MRENKKDSTIIYPMGDRPIVLAEFVVILLDCGTSLAKPRDMRFPVSNEALHIRTMWETALASTAGAQAIESECVACGQSGAASRVVTRCPVCQLAMHTSCCKEVVARIQGLIPIPDKLVELPVVFRLEHLCALCAQVYRG